MALDALRGYISLAGGLTEITKAKATAQAKALLADDTLASVLANGQKAQVQVQALADEIVAAGRANREFVTNLVRVEVERVMSAAGVAATSDVDAQRASIDRLERRVAILESELAARTAQQRSAKKVAKKAVKKVAPTSTDSSAASTTASPDASSTRGSV